MELCGKLRHNNVFKKQQQQPPPPHPQIIQEEKCFCINWKKKNLPKSRPQLHFQFLNELWNFIILKKNI